jgi:hypothetical protein
MRVTSGGVAEVGFVDPHDPTGVKMFFCSSLMFGAIIDPLNSYICIPASGFFF